ncbi:MAG: NAD(P)H-hydrate dehydratase [Clostridia bacterium]|nr:NAD(P)H-hydrate dehydratase [Clostridia bacterium]
MYILTNGQMREADGYTIKDLKTPSRALMDRAGRALAQTAEELVYSGDILCVCGGGNNGGDGFVCARVLKTGGRNVDTVCFAERFSEDCRINKEKWIEQGGKIYSEIPRDKKYALVIDCLFGTGFRGSLDGKNAETVLQMNELKETGAKILSADIPSGVNGDNGIVSGAAVRADKTLCIGEIKAGAVLCDGLDYAGKVTRADIGISLPERGYATWIDKTSVSLPTRKRNSHKGSYGKAAIVGGSERYTGAAYLAATACLRSGAGYTALFVPENILPYYYLKTPELLLRPLKKETLEELLGYDSVAYGMGMGISREVADGAVWLLKRYAGRLILDADGLNSLAVYEKENLSGLFANKKCEVAITPHLKEFSRLSGKEIQDILEEGLTAAKAFASEHGVTVLLKNAATIVTDGVRIAVNTAGNSGQAKGGSGDVLSGLIAGLCATGLSVFEGAKLGAYLSGIAAELASVDIGEYSLTASDVVAYLGRAFLTMR